MLSRLSKIGILLLLLTAAMGAYPIHCQLAAHPEPVRTATLLGDDGCSPDDACCTGTPSWVSTDGKVLLPSHNPCGIQPARENGLVINVSASAHLIGPRFSLSKLCKWTV